MAITPNVLALNACRVSVERRGQVHVEAAEKLQQSSRQQEHSIMACGIDVQMRVNFDLHRLQQHISQRVSKPLPYW
jgi:hypothetical protein